MFLRKWWLDPRLTFVNGSVNFSGTPSLIWFPDLFFLNALSTKVHETLEKNTRIQVASSGDVYMSTR